MNTLQDCQKISGWCSPQKQAALHSIVIATRPIVSVEIGVWCGKSLIPIALAHKHVLKGCVIGVDPWMSNASIEGQLNPADVEWWRDQSKHEWAYKELDRHAGEFSVRMFMDIRRIKSSEFVAPDGIGLFHCDGNHGDRAFHDVTSVAPKVLVGGFVVLDDLRWTGGAVSRSVDWIEASGFKRLYVVDDFETSNQWGVWQRTK